MPSYRPSKRRLRKDGRHIYHQSRGEQSALLRRNDWLWKFAYHYPKMAAKTESVAEKSSNLNKNSVIGRFQHQVYGQNTWYYTKNILKYLEYFDIISGILAK